MRESPTVRQASERILVRGPNPAGDLVMATASFADIRRSFPRASITLLLKPGRGGVVEGASYFDELLVDDSSAGPRALLRLVRQLRRGRFDRCILFTHSFRTALALALAEIPERIGYPKGGQGFFLTRPVEPVRRTWRKWLPTPMPDIYARLCEAAGVLRGDGRPRLYVTPECEDEYRKRRDDLGIGDGERLIGLAPGASFGASKLWPPAHLAELADRLASRYGLRTMIFAAPGEREIAAELVERMRSRPINTADSPLGLNLLKPFIRDLKLLVTMDSGPRHYAAAFRVPAVVLMGPTDPRWTAANLDFQDVVRHDVDCGPCQLKVCPLDHRCMTGIHPAEVMARIEQLDERLGIF